ncbi:hypothetical protein [Pseudomonas phage D6]|nr:hypothetical protein [Pseudomonas phage D6]
MGCCEDCKSAVEGNRVEFDVDVHFGDGSGVDQNLVGQGIDFVGGHLLTVEGAMPKGGFQIQFNSYGERKHINVYRKQLPFDELISTIQFNSETGEYRVQNLTLVEFEKVRLTLTKERIDPPEYQELAKGVYRVPNYNAGLRLSCELDIYDYTLVQLQRHLRENKEWPALILHHNRDLCVMYNVGHETWKNDALWQ